MINKKDDFKNNYFAGFKTLFPVLTESEFLSYYDESIYGGYPEERGGSVWESEGKSIYVLIRILKPKKILEIGNYKGVSSNHILQAVEKNGFGEVVLDDIEEKINYSRIRNRDFKRILQDSLVYLNVPFGFDLIIQDGDHTYEHVKKEIELILKNNQQKEYYIWSHDYYTSDRSYIEVGMAWDEMKINFTAFRPFIDSVSNCGFSIAYNRSRLTPPKDYKIHRLITA